MQSARHTSHKWNLQGIQTTINTVCDTYKPHMQGIHFTDTFCETCKFQIRYLILDPPYTTKKRNVAES